MHSSNLNISKFYIYLFRQLKEMRTQWRPKMKKLRISASIPLLPAFLNEIIQRRIFFENPLAKEQSLNFYKFYG